MNLERLKQVTYVDVTLWLMRAAVILLVIAGTIGTVIKDRYTTEQWVSMVMFGLTIGGIYALIALGYTMVYGILRLINFAHGDIFMTGAFTAYFVAAPLAKSGFLDEYLIVGMVLISLVAMTVCSCIALIVERICYRPFRSVRSLAPLICAIGASFFLQHAFRGMYGSSVRAYPDVRWFDVVVTILGFNFPRIQFVVVIAALASMYALYLIVHKTKMGTAMRAVSEDRDAAALMGIDVNKVIIFTLFSAAARPASAACSMPSSSSRFISSWASSRASRRSAPRCWAASATCRAPCSAASSSVWSSRWDRPCSWMVWALSRRISFAT